MYWWDLRGSEPHVRQVAIAFYRNYDEEQCVGVRLSIDSVEANQIATAIEEALDVDAVENAEVRTLLLCGATSVQINSRRLKGIGAALLERAARLLEPTPFTRPSTFPTDGRAASV